MCPRHIGARRHPYVCTHVASGRIIPVQMQDSPSQALAGRAALARQGPVALDGNQSPRPFKRNTASWAILVPNASG